MKHIPLFKSILPLQIMSFVSRLIFPAKYKHRDNHFQKPRNNPHQSQPTIMFDEFRVFGLAVWNFETSFQIWNSLLGCTELRLQIGRDPNGCHKLFHVTGMQLRNSCVSFQTVSMCHALLVCSKRTVTVTFSLLSLPFLHFKFQVHLFPLS